MDTTDRFILPANVKSKERIIRSIGKNELLWPHFVRILISFLHIAAVIQWITVTPQCRYCECADFICRTAPVCKQGENHSGQPQQRAGAATREADFRSEENKI